MSDQMAAFRDFVKNEHPDELEALWIKMDFTEWNVDENPSLKASEVASILRRYLNGELTEQQVEDWADYVEAFKYSIESNTRDDVRFEMSEALFGIIHFLGNPILEQCPLTPQYAQELLDKLQSA